MKQKLCTACKDNENVSLIEADASWIKSFHNLNRRIGAPIHTERYKLLQLAGFPQTIPDFADTQVVIKTNHVFRKIYFFAANPMSLLCAVNNNLSTAEKAYGDYTNSGVALKQRNGTFVLKLRSPQPYLDKNVLFPRHVHYFDVHKPKTIYTVSCVPDHDKVTPIIKTHMCNEIPSMFLCFEKAFMANHMNALCINALKQEDGSIFTNEQHIPSSSSIFEIKQILKNTSKVTPLLVYCYKPTCNAAVTLINKLQKLGYNNVFYYPGGVEEYMEKRKLLR